MRITSTESTISAHFPTGAMVPSRCTGRPVLPGETFRIGDVDVTPVSIPHGPISVYGYRIGNLGYITDAKELPEDAVRASRGVDVLVLNALFRKPHPTHLSVSEAVSAAQKIGA